MDQKHLQQRLKGLSGGSRLQILSYLKRHGSATVTEIAHAVDRSVQTVSEHLLRLETLGIVLRRQRGKFAAYRISLHQEPLVRHVLAIL